MSGKSIGVIGAGAWGTGLAQALARGGNTVVMWAMEQDVVDSVNSVSSCFSVLLGMMVVVSVMYILSVTVIIFVGGA